MEAKSTSTLEEVPVHCLVNSKAIDLTIIDMAGNIVEQTICEHARIQLNATNLKNGTYSWEARLQNNVIAAGKFIVENQS